MNSFPPDLELIGHGAPLGCPGPLVPVGELAGALVAVFLGESDVSVVPLEVETDLIRHSDSVRDSLASFDFTRERLFAFDDNRVVKYPAKDEAAFFNAILRRDQISRDLPFVRLSLAKATGEKELIVKESERCLETLRNISPKFANTWAEAEGTGRNDPREMRSTTRSTLAKDSVAFTHSSRSMESFRLAVASALGFSSEVERRDQFGRWDFRTAKKSEKKMYKGITWHKVIYNDIAKLHTLERKSLNIREVGAAVNIIVTLETAVPAVSHIAASISDRRRKQVAEKYVRSLDDLVYHGKRSVQRRTPLPNGIVVRCLRAHTKFKNVVLSGSKLNDPALKEIDEDAITGKLRKRKVLKVIFSE